MKITSRQGEIPDRRSGSVIARLLTVRNPLPGGGSGEIPEPTV